MRRKINRVGQNTLTVSLPSKWALANGIRPGDEIELVEKDNALILNSKLNIPFKEIKIKLSSDNIKFIKAIIRNLYFHGFEKIYVTYNSYSNYGSILKAINNLDGFETSNESDKGCEIVSFSEIKLEKFDIFYNKLFSVIKYMQELFSDLLKKDNKSNDLETMKDLNSKSSKYACICRRILTRSQIMNKDESISKLSIINILHMISRNYFNCYCEIIKNKKDISQMTIKFNDLINEIFIDINKIHLNKISLKNYSITEKRENILKNEFSNLIMNSFGIDSLVLHYLGEVVRLFGTISPKIEIMNLFFKQ